MLLDLKTVDYFQNFRHGSDNIRVSLSYSFKFELSLLWAANDDTSEFNSVIH